MSYQEQAQGINRDLEQLFNSIPLQSFSKEQREHILNIIIRVGQVAKFRCRSNTAYDNFITACFNNIADCERVELEPGTEFKILKAVLK